MTGRPLYVAVTCALETPVDVLVRMVAPPMSWWTVPVIEDGKKFSDTQPFVNVVARLSLLADSSTFVLLNVITLASQQIESTPVGGGGENVVCAWTVASSRLYCVS